MFQVLIKILQINNFQAVNIESDRFIYTLFTAPTSVCNSVCYITVNFRKKLHSCQAITHFFTNYQVTEFTNYYQKN